jgi:hypothetical protein
VCEPDFRFVGFCSHLNRSGLVRLLRLEAEGIGYTIRLAANRVLQDRIGYLLKRPVGRPPQGVRRYFACFGYKAQSWNKSRHVVAKVEWHPRMIPTATAKGGYGA